MTAGTPDPTNPDQGAQEAPATASAEVFYTEAGIARMNPDQGDQLGRLQAAIEQDYADDVATADALYSRVQQLASATRQAAIEAAASRRQSRLALAGINNTPSEVAVNDE